MIEREDHDPGRPLSWPIRAAIALFLLLSCWMTAAGIWSAVTLII